MRIAIASCTFLVLFFLVAATAYAQDRHSPKLDTVESCRAYRDAWHTSVEKDVKALTRQLLAYARGSPPESPVRLWPEIFRQLEREKFRSDLAQLSEKDSELLRAFARGDREEFAPSQVGQEFDRVYFRRLTEKGLLVRTGRGRYKLYHPLFKLFLQGLKT